MLNLSTRKTRRCWGAVAKVLSDEGIEMIFLHSLSGAVVHEKARLFAPLVTSARATAEEQRILHMDAKWPRLAGI